MADDFTAFVGPNNSGKSSVLRFFLEFRSLFGLLSYQNRNLLSALQGKWEGVSFVQVNDQQEVFCNLNDRPMEILFEPTVVSDEHSVKGLAITISRNLTWTITSIKSRGFTIPSSDNFGWHTPNELALPGEHFFKFTDFFNEISAFQNSMYVGPFRNAINIGGQDGYYDISVGTKFVETWRHWKTGPSKQQNSKAMEVQSEIQKIFNLKSLEISDAEKLNTLQVYINGKSYKLNELGSGMAEFVIVLGNAAIRQPNFIFIDEPEIHLHPTLQMQFLITLSSYAKNGIVFATHSVGLSRSVAQRIYSVTQDSEGRSLVHDFDETPMLPEFLGELSFRSFKDVGYEKILLVEGVHDIKTVQQFLRKLQKDTKVVLIHLGGSAMVSKEREPELEEIKRMCDHIFVLIDSEKSNQTEKLSSNREEFAQSCKKFGFETCVLELRAIENYLSEDAIQRVKGNKYHALQPYQKLDEVNPSWAKHENWKIAKEMNFEEIKNTDLGRFLYEL